MHTCFSHLVVDTVLPCPYPNIGDPIEWLYVSLDTPFAVLNVYLTYCNESPSSAVYFAGIWYKRKHKQRMCGII